MSSLSMLVEPKIFPEPTGGRVVRKLGLHDKPGRKPGSDDDLDDGPVDPEAVKASEKIAQLKAELARAEAMARRKPVQLQKVLRVLKKRPGLSADRVSQLSGIPMSSIYTVLHRLRRDGDVRAKRQEDETGSSRLRWFATALDDVKGPA